MKMSKNKFKIILVIIASIILTSGISVYATYNYFAKDVSYTKLDGTELSVEEALNELYDKNSGNIEYIAFNSGVISSSAGTFYTKTISVPKDKKMVYIYSSVSSTYSLQNPKVSSNIIDEQKTVWVGGSSISGKIANNCYLSTIKTNEEEGDITISYNVRRWRPTFCPSNSILSMRFLGKFQKSHFIM